MSGVGEIFKQRSAEAVREDLSDQSLDGIA